jgi:hypothetical protein
MPYYATDENILYRDTGSAWEKVGVADYSDLDSIPSTFAPSAHTHAAADVTSGTFADNRLASPNNDVYRTVFSTWGRISQSQAQGTLILPGYNSLVVSGVDTGGGATAWDLVATDLDVAGKTTKLRLKCQVHTNATAPGINYTFGLYPFTVAGGTNLMGYTVGTVISGSTVLFTTPAASSDLTLDSGDFDLPSDDRYVIAAAMSGAQPAAAMTMLSAQIQVHHI